MATVWTALGAVMGASLGMEGGGILGAIGGMMAGMVEMAALGAIFGLIGGRPEETLLGAVGGAMVGLTTGAVGGQPQVVLGTNYGLIVGAIAGATLRPYLRLLSLPVLLLGRVLPSRPRRQTVEEPLNEGADDPRPLIPVTRPRRITAGRSVPGLTHRRDRSTAAPR